MKAKSFDQKFDQNASDIVGDLELSTVRRPNREQNRVNVDFPTWILLEALQRLKK